MRRKSEASRARRWAERNSGSWAMKESPSQKLEFSDGGIEVYVYYFYISVYGTYSPLYFVPYTFIYEYRIKFFNLIDGGIGCELIFLT